MLKPCQVFRVRFFFALIQILIFSQTAAADFISSETLLTQTDNLPYYLKDRGTGVPLSMFGAYIEKGQLYIYPFIEYYRDKNFEYAPEDLGYAIGEDYLGKYRATEGLLFFGYGITDWLAVELEAAVITAELEKADDDPSAMPDTLRESGLGDVEGQLRWRWINETDRHPELFSYFETVFPLQKDKVLIGTQDWEYKFGIGVTKGFSFGTLTVRTAVEYDRGEDKTELGEYAVEYLKKVSSRWRLYAGVEGALDEVELITEAQLHLNRNMFFKLNNAF
ncbi:MAG TPA: hypothetical protein VI702_01240, partial [Nitrospiria bacterium]